MPPIGQGEWLLYRWHIHIHSGRMQTNSFCNKLRTWCIESICRLTLSYDYRRISDAHMLSQVKVYICWGRVTLSALYKIMGGSYTQKHVQIQPSWSLTRVSYWWKYVHVEEVGWLMTCQSLRVSYTPKCIEVRSTWQRHLSDFEGVFQVKVCTCRGSPTINM